MIKYIIISLITIIIVLIVNIIVRIVCDTQKLVADTTNLDDNTLDNFQVIAAGCTRSCISRFPNEWSDVICHMDILYLCKSDIDNRYYFVFIPKLKINDVNYTKPFIIPNVHKFKFKFGGFKYRILNFEILDYYITLKEIHEIYKKISQLPYHLLYNNCHHIAKMTYNILLHKSLNNIEFNPSQLKSIEYFGMIIKDFVNNYILKSNIKNKHQ